MNPLATIVVPCYNEERRLQPGPFHDFVSRRPNIRFLFVDDGSTDRTLAVLIALCRGYEDRLNVLPSPRNRGKAEAVRLGFLHTLAAPSPYIGFWDADLATPLDTIPPFLALLESRPTLDMVFGSRVQLLGRKIERKPVRHYLGRVFATQASLLLGLPIYDTQCGAKIFRSSPELADIFAQPFVTTWTFDVEILARFLVRRRSGKRLEDSIFEYPLERWRDVDGSKVRPQHFLTALRDLWRIYFRYLR